MCVSDVSLCALPAGAALSALPAYARGLLELGVGCLEMPAPIWERLRGVVPAERAVVAVDSVEELERLRGEGVSAFVLDADIAAACEPEQATGLTQAADLMVSVRTDDADAALRAAVRLSKLFAAVRVQGLDGALAAGGDALFPVLAHLPGAVSLDMGDSLHLATAASVEWALAGGGAVCASFRGLGGHAPLEQVLAALRVLCGAAYDLSHLPQVCAAFTALTGEAVPPHAPVVGRDIFAYESGIHADGIRKDPKTYEPFPPESVGGARRLSIGKHSGKAALCEKLSTLGVQPDEAALERLNEQVRARSTGMRRGFTDEELLALAKSMREKAGER